MGKNTSKMEVTGHTEKPDNRDGLAQSKDVVQINTIEEMAEIAGECPQCSGKTKERSEKEYRDLMNRLKRIEGQVRGVQGMLEKNAYCPDILVQVSAVNAALNSFSRVLLANHIRTCVSDGIRDGDNEVIDELVNLMQKLMK